MKRAVLAVTLAATLAGGCVTGASIIRKDEVSLPLLLGTVAADLVVTTAIASQLQDFTAAAAVSTALAVTASDTVVACLLLRGCKSLRP